MSADISDGTKEYPESIENLINQLAYLLYAEREEMYFMTCMLYDEVERETTDYEEKETNAAIYNDEMLEHSLDYY